jgi:hypothetical protein
MMKIALAVLAAAAVLMTAPLVTPAKAQVDMQGRHFDDRDPGAFYRERRRYDSNATVDVGPGGVTIGPRQRCHVGTTTIERHDRRRITRRRCDYIQFYLP